MRSEETKTVSSPSPRPFSPIRERGRNWRDWLGIGLGAAFVLVAAFLATTWIALEGREVVVLRTFDATGQARETRAWVADEDGSVWIESANADRPFFRQVLSDPRVELVRRGETRSFRAAAVANPQGHLRIRRLLARKYGWADRWIGLLTDTSGSIALRLDPADVSRTVPP